MCKCIGKADWVLSHVLTLVMATEFVSGILVYLNCVICQSKKIVMNFIIVKASRYNSR